jgi:hypothetical protein
MKLRAAAACVGFVAACASSARPPEPTTPTALVAIAAPTARPSAPPATCDRAEVSARDATPFTDVVATSNFAFVAADLAEEGLLFASGTALVAIDASGAPRVHEHALEGAPRVGPFAVMGRSERDLWVVTEAWGDGGFSFTAAHRAGERWDRAITFPRGERMLYGSGPWLDGAAVGVQRSHAGINAFVVLRGPSSAQPPAPAPPPDRVAVFRSFPNGTAAAIAPRHAGGATLWSIAATGAVPTRTRIPLADACGEDVADVEAWSTPRVDRITAILRAASQREYVADWDGERWRFTPAPFGLTGPFRGDASPLELGQRQWIARATDDDATWVISDRRVWRRHGAGPWEHAPLPEAFDVAARGPHFDAEPSLLVARTYDDAWIAAQVVRDDAPDVEATLMHAGVRRGGAPVRLRSDDGARKREWDVVRYGEGGP